MGGYDSKTLRADPLEVTLHGHGSETRSCSFWEWNELHSLWFIDPHEAKAQ